MDQRSSEASALIESMLDDPHFLFTYLGFEGIERLSALLTGEDLTLMGSLLPRIAALGTMEAGARDVLLTAMAHVVVDLRHDRPQRIPVSQVLVDLRAALDAADSGSADQETSPNAWLEARLPGRSGWDSMFGSSGWDLMFGRPGWASVSEHPGWGRLRRQSEHSGRSLVLEHLGIERLELPLSELLALVPDDLISSDGELSLGDALRESMAAGELKREERTLNLPEETFAAGSAAESCTVCLEDFDDGVSVMRLACGHIYHPACIREWVCHRATCPSCRAQIVWAKSNAS